MFHMLDHPTDHPEAAKPGEPYSGEALVHAQSRPNQQFARVRARALVRSYVVCCVVGEGRQCSLDEFRSLNLI